MNRLTPRAQARLDGIPEAQLHHYPDSLDAAEQERHQSEYRETSESSPRTKRRRRSTQAENATVTEAVNDDLPYPPPRSPMRVAYRILAEVFTTPEGHHSLKYWRGDWYQWTGPHWDHRDHDDIARALWLHLNDQVWKRGDHIEEWAPTQSKIADVLKALQAIVTLDKKREAPLWIGDDAGHEVVELTSMSNGLLHRPTREMSPHTPLFFNLWSLPYEYDPQAVAPRWGAFIADTFAADPAGAQALQEFFGYTLTNDADQQKGLMLIGPPGGGKGVANRVLVSLTGTQNVASTDPHTLRGDFGLWPLIGKPLAVLSDARSDGPINAIALGRLLNIIGQDQMSINRKGAAFWSGYLNTRVVWISNDLPRFNDTSGAILRRWVVIRLDHAVPEAQRDPHLSDKLHQEMPGILNWALAGLDRLNEQGRFTEPASQGDALAELRDTVSPVSAFLQDCFTVTGSKDDYVPMSDVLSQYRAWAEANGREKLNRETLRDRINSCPEPVEMKHTVPCEGVPKSRWVFGVKKRKTEWSVYPK